MFQRKLIFILVFLAACRPAQPTPFAATVPPSELPGQIAQIVTAVPTAHPISTRTPTLPPTDTLTPSNTPTITPTPTITLSPTITLTPTITPSTTPISSATPTNPADDPNNTPPPTWTPPPPDPSVQIADHYHFGRPIADGSVNWEDATYPYGGTSGGKLQVHHGVDMVNPRGTPILAAGDGTVVYAGNDQTTQFGATTNYYGNLVVIQHPFTSPEGLPVFTLYGHMDRVDVQTGQQVTKGQQVGIVGATGIAIGPHVHFEVRVGDPYSFGATRNPALWIYPFQTFGTLAGRVTDANGAVLYDVTLRVQSTDISRYAFSYADDSVNPDSTFHENFTLADLPPNYYAVTVSDQGRVRFRKIVYVYPNRTTWVDVQLSP
jgi:murein DD-endopeptidase MepM/ murein hydrolase activator NlpD